MKKFTLFCILSLLTGPQLQAYQLRGTVADKEGKPIPGVNVYIAKSTYGVVTNIKGQYYLELQAGSYRIVFQAIGYEKQVHVITIGQKDLIRHVVLKENFIELGEITVTPGKEDPAYPIIRKCIAAAEGFRRHYESYRCSSYTKVSLEKESREMVLDTVEYRMNEEVSREKMNMVESINTIWFAQTDKYKEIRHAFIDHTEKKRLDFGQSASIGITWEPNGGEDDFTAPQAEGNPFLFYDNIYDADFNFYQNLMKLPELSDRPFISPIGKQAFLHYRYQLVDVFEEDSHRVYKIKLTPKREYGAYFSGDLYVVDGLWNLKAVNLSLDKEALRLYREMEILINYQQIEDSFWVAEREEFFYNGNERDSRLIGHSVSLYSDYEMEPEISRKTFKGGRTEIDKNAIEKGQTYWAKKRPLTLKPEEKTFVIEQDSIRRHFSSPEYIRTADSSYNETGWVDFLLTGVGYRNSLNGTKFHLGPVISQPRPLAVGGYRHAVYGSYHKEWDKAHKLELNGEFSYGFLNKDLRGRGRVAYRYKPKSFNRIIVEGGSIYEMVNTNEAIAAAFSRRNFVQSETFSIGHEHELINGLFVLAKINYSDQKSLENIQLSDWSNRLFGQINVPQPFERYTKTVFETRLTIRFKQQYKMEPYRKVLLGSKYPELRFFYNLGIPNLLGSDVSFHYLELRANDRFQIGTFGTSYYRISTGTFIRPRGIRYIDNKFFRGSVPYIFSQPTRSYQLMGTSINTREPYLQGHYLHSFNENLLGKVPLLKRLQLRSVVGGSLLAELSNDYLHTEAYFGIEKPFIVADQIFKIGCYYVGTKGTHTGGYQSAIKFGIDFFNSFTNSWNY